MHTSNRRRLRRLALAAPAVVALALAGCSKDDSSTSTGATTAGTSASAPGGSTVAAEPKVRTLQLDVMEEGDKLMFKDVPSTFPGGTVMIALTNDGKVEHQANVARIKDGTTWDQVKAALDGPTPEIAATMVDLVGGPNSVAPGTTGRVITEMKPGEYVAVCFFPTVPGDGKPHAAHGMYAHFTVTAPPADDDPQLPQAAGTIALKDYAITLPDGFTGKGWYEVTNDGPQPHEAAFYKLAQGTTAEQMKAAMMADPSTAPTGPPPWSPAGGIGGLAPGGTAWVELDLPKGDYAGLCFIPAAPPAPDADFKPHLAHGMFTPFTIS